MAVRWTGYKDSGREVVWWFGYQPRSIGWGIAEPGHNVILADPTDWREVVPTGVLSHMGKHAFLLLTEPGGGLPEAARSYLQVLKPPRVNPSQQVFNFGWVTGRGVSGEAMGNLSGLLNAGNVT